MDTRIALLPPLDGAAAMKNWLEWIKSVGYTGLYIEADPLGQPRGNMTQFSSLYRGLPLYDLAWGARRRELREYIQQACDLAHAQGLTVYLSLWEPRLPAEAWGLLPPAWRGHGSWDQPPFDQIPWCMSHPQAVEGFEQMAAEAFASVPSLDGLKIGCHDNEAFLCNQRCPRCKDQSPGGLIQTVITSLFRASERAGLHRRDFDYVLYTWWWTKEELTCLEEAAKGRRITLLGRSSQGLTQQWKGQPLGSVFDLALGLEGIGQGFVDLLSRGNKQGWRTLDMLPTGHAFEYFWLPATPAPQALAKRIADLSDLGCAGWFDYDCGTIDPGINAEVIRQAAGQPAMGADQWVEATLARLYPPHELPQARQAYDLAAQALAARPIGISPAESPLMSGRNWLEAAIALPFDVGSVSLADQGHRQFWFSPANFLLPAILPILLEMYEQSSRLWAVAWLTLTPLRGQETALRWRDQDLPWEKRVFRAHALASGSAYRYVQMGANRWARTEGRLTPQDERNRLLSLCLEELPAAQEMAGLWQEDRRLFSNPFMRWSEFLRSCAPWIPVDREDPFAAKIAHTQSLITRLDRGGDWDATPYWPQTAVDPKG